MTRGVPLVIISVLVTRVPCRPVQPQHVGVVIDGTEALELKTAGTISVAAALFLASAQHSLTTDRLVRGLETFQPRPVGVAIELDHGFGGVLLASRVLIAATGKFDQETFTG